MSELKPVRSIEDALKDSNIVNREKFHESVKFVFDQIAFSVGRTLGPGGGYTVISNIDATVPVYPTKDGYTVAHEYRFNDQTKWFIAEILKDIPRRMNLNVGDGTTSGLIIASELYDNLMKYELTEIHPEIGCILPPCSINIILEEILAVVMDEFIKDSKYIIKNTDIEREVENRLIRKIATISANNDPEIGESVSKLFVERSSNHVYITNEVGTDDETFIDKDVGFTFGGGFINPQMANQPDRITCKFEHPRFLLVDGPLTENDLPNLNKFITYVIEDLKKPLVIVAKDFDQQVLNSIIARLTRCVIRDRAGNDTIHEKEPIACLTVDSQYEKSYDRLEDLRIILGCEVMSTKKGKIMEFRNNVSFIEAFLGSADEFKGTQLSTRIRRGGGAREPIMERIAHLEKRIGEISRNDGILAFTSIAELEKRISMLNSDMTVINVGGANDKERRAKKLIYDDAILACQSAIENGFTLGGNVSIFHYLEFNIDNLVNSVSASIIEKGRHIVVGNGLEDVKTIVGDIATIVKYAFKEAYYTAVENMVGNGTPAFKKIDGIVYGTEYDGVVIDDAIKAKLKERPIIFDLVTGKVSSLADEDPSPIVPGNTDFELMKAIFGTVGTLVSSNQFLTIYPGDSTIYRANRQ